MHYHGRGRIFSRINKHKIFISCGHDEYWSLDQRSNVKYIRDEMGISLMFWSGNEMYWKIDFQNIQDNFDQCTFIFSIK